MSNHTNQVSTIDLDHLIAIAEHIATTELTPLERKRNERVLLAFECIREMIHRHGSPVNQPTQH